MKGRCLCGDVVFEFEGKTTEIGMCHCSLCRKVSGVASNAELMASAEHFRWLEGEERIQRFELPSGWRTWFCARCGSNLPKLHPSGGAYWVPAGLLDEDPRVRVAGHIFVGSKAAWDEIGGEAPQYLEGFGSEKVPDPADQGR